METNFIKLFSAFSGYDSVLMALLRLCSMYYWLRVKLVGWCDIDPYAIACHNVNFPEHINSNYGDISKIDWDKVEDFDLFSMTFPCQDYSYSGKRMGGAEGSGTRSALLWECEKAIAKKRPRFVLLENVKPLTDVNNEGTFLKWQQRISKYGYVNYSYDYIDSIVDKKYYLSQAKCNLLLKLLKSTVGDTIKTNTSSKNKTSDIINEGYMKEQYVTPVCRGNVIPTLTSQGAHGIPRAMFSTGEHPCPGIIEIWTKK